MLWTPWPYSVPGDLLAQEDKGGNAVNHFPAEMAKGTVYIYARYNTSCPGVRDSNWYDSRRRLPERCQSAGRNFLDLSTIRRLLVVMVSISLFFLMVLDHTTLMYLLHLSFACL